MIATSDSTRRGADALLWTVYVLAPSFGAGLVHGVPLGPLGAVALLLIWWLVLVRWRLPGGPAAAAAGLAALFVASVIPGEPGFRGRYDADSAASAGTPPDVTRVDRRLDFSNDATELPLASFDANQAFAAVWDGHWWSAGEAPHMFYLYAPGASAELVVDGIVVATVTPPDGCAHRRRGAEPRLASSLRTPLVTICRTPSFCGGRADRWAADPVQRQRRSDRSHCGMAAQVSTRVGYRQDSVRCVCAPAADVARCRSGRRFVATCRSRRTSVRADRRTFRSRGHHRSVGVCLARGRPPVAAPRRRPFSGSANLS